MAAGFAQSVARQFRRELRVGIAATRPHVDGEAALNAFVRSLDVDAWERLMVGVYVGDAVNEVWSAEQLEMGMPQAEPPRAEDYEELRREARRQAELIVQGTIAALYREYDRSRKTKQGEDGGFVRRLARGLYRRSFTRTRAGSIAAQAVLQATSQVQQLSQATVARITGGRVVRIWTTVGDDRVRDPHRAADGDREGVDGYFIVGGERLRRPRDPAGSTWNIINCRCSAPAIIVGGTSPEEGALTLDPAATVVDVDDVGALTFNLQSAVTKAEVDEVLVGLSHAKLDEIADLLTGLGLDPELRTHARYRIRLLKKKPDPAGVGTPTVPKPRAAARGADAVDDAVLLAPGQAPSLAETQREGWRGMFQRRTLGRKLGDDPRPQLRGQIDNYLDGVDPLNKVPAATRRQMVSHVNSETGQWSFGGLTDAITTAKNRVQTSLGRDLSAVVLREPKLEAGMRSFFLRSQTRVETDLARLDNVFYKSMIQGDNPPLRRWAEGALDFTAAFGDEATYAAELLSQSYVNVMVRQWAQSSGDHYFNSLFQQRAIAAEFFDDADEARRAMAFINQRAGSSQARSFIQGEYRDIFDPIFDDELVLARAFQRAQYQSTQRWLRDNNLIDEDGRVLLFRGMDVARGKAKKALVRGDEEFQRLSRGLMNVQANPATSWTLSSPTARSFSGGMTGTARKGNPRLVFEARMPAERILATPGSGYGCLNEYEFVCLSQVGDTVSYVVAG